MARSVVGDLLEFMPPERAKRLHGLLDTVAFGTYLSVMMPVVAWLLIIFITMASSGGTAPRGYTRAMIIGPLFLAPLVMLALTWWNLASLDGVPAETRAGRTAKRVCWTLVVGYLAWLGPVLFSVLVGQVSAFSFSLAGNVTTGSGIRSLIVLTCYAVWVGFSAAYFWNAQDYLAMIARQVPDPLLEHRARSRRLGAVLWWTIGLLAMFLGPLVAMSNLVSTVRDCRFHTKRARNALRSASAGGVASGSPTTPDTLAHRESGSGVHADPSAG